MQTAALSSIGDVQSLDWMMLLPIVIFVAVVALISRGCAPVGQFNEERIEKAKVDTTKGLSNERAKQNEELGRLSELAGERNEASLDGDYPIEPGEAGGSPGRSQ